MKEANKVQRLCQNIFYKVFGYSSTNTFWGEQWKKDQRTKRKMDKGLRRQARLVKRLQKENATLKEDKESMTPKIQKQLAEWLVECGYGERWIPKPKYSSLPFPILVITDVATDKAEPILIETPDSELNDAQFRAKREQIEALTNYLMNDSQWFYHFEIGFVKCDTIQEILVYCILKCAEDMCSG
jgi:hypothetical protein